MEISSTPSQPQPSVIRHTLDTVRIIHDTLLTLTSAVKASSQHKNMEEGDSKDVEDTGDDDGEDDDVFEEGIYRPDRQTDSDDDIDDIELVFTTAETDPVSIHEDMVSIRDGSTRSMHTVLVETDISKCGVIEEHEEPCLSRRNTLPAPAPYRPIMHREILGMNRGPIKSQTPSTGKITRKTESGAQTDITALPGQWKSETYLAHKISYNLTTLPSKFTLPVPTSSQIPSLNNKTTEARRVLLSDINFTSMVPELSRSADHLPKREDSCQQLCKNYPQAFDYMKSFDVGREGRRCDFSGHNSRSSWGSYSGARCQPSTSCLSQPPPPSCSCHFQPRRRHSWRPPTTNVCCRLSSTCSSVPSSPNHCTSSARYFHTQTTEQIPSARHQSSYMYPGQSLPDLRDMDSDSTDSLVDEAEEFLRHQIDALLVGKRGGRSKRCRSLSEARSQAEFVPSKSAQPFLPRCPRDLKRGFLVKVITGEGRVVVGRVGYSGSVAGHAEPYVGVQLPQPTGISDGTFLGHRYFECDRDHALFVPFKKVVIAWST